MSNNSFKPGLMQVQEKIRYFDPETGQWMIATIENGKMVTRPESGGNSVITQAATQLYDGANFVYLRELHDLEKQRQAGELAIRLRYEGKVGGKQRADKSIFDYNRQEIDPQRKAIEARHGDRKSKAGDAIFLAQVKMTSTEVEQATEMIRLQGEDELAKKRGEQAVGSAKAQALIQDIADDQIHRTEKKRIERVKSLDEHASEIRKAEAAQTHSHRLAEQQEENTTKVTIAKLQTVAETARVQQAHDQKNIDRSFQIARDSHRMRADLELAQATMPEEIFKKGKVMLDLIDEDAGFMRDPSSLSFEEQRVYSERMISRQAQFFALVTPYIQKIYGSQK